MNEDQSTSLLNTFPNLPLNKKGLEAWAEVFIQDKLALEPTIDLMEQVKRIQTVMDVMENRLREVLKQEYAGNPGSYKGLDISFRGGSRKFDYSRDRIWNELNTALTEREAFLKTLKEPTDIRVDDELVTAYPPRITYGKESVTISLK